MAPSSQNDGFCAASSEDPNGGWEFLEEASGVRVHTKNIEGCPVVALRAETTLPYPMDQIFAVVHEPTLKSQWVDRLSVCELIEQQLDGPDKKEIHYMVLEMPWPVSSRDFVLETSFHVNKSNGTVGLEVRSLQHDDAPVVEDYVRGHVYSGNVILSTVSDGVTHVKMDSCVDPGGLIPAMIVNLVQRTWAFNTVEKIRALLAENKLPADPVFDALMKAD